MLLQVHLKFINIHTEHYSPVVAINYMLLVKDLGDKFTVTGSTADNSIVIWAASANTGGLKFTTTDNGVTFTPTSSLTIGTLVSLSSASAGPLENGDFYFECRRNECSKIYFDRNFNWDNSRYSAGTAGNAIRFSKYIAGDEYVVAFALGTGVKMEELLESVGGVPSASVLYATTTTFGTNSAWWPWRCFGSASKQFCI